LSEEQEAERIIAALNLQPHPEGGYFAETFRDTPAEGGRAFSTAIYFLLRRGESSRWHRVRDAAEVWHHYAGAPLRLEITPDLRAIHERRLGKDIAGGERPQ